ncbi:hypothetical protein EB796_001780 [Bugula neritina]|uniref:Uncharacterized protein n=1 Tax=Bugula neritina TaxID=10212 RepID=A0A7J7KP49_BUGNE|nr:hypothetical protein EB796_001780 [Bugula neritina]
MLFLIKSILCSGGSPFTSKVDVNLRVETDGPGDEVNPSNHLTHHVDGLTVVQLHSDVALFSATTCNNVGEVCLGVVFYVDRVYLGVVFYVGRVYLGVVFYTTM